MKAQDLKLGMRVDLEGDLYADPDKQTRLFAEEFQTVSGVVWESSACVCVYFDGGAVGFPPEHNLTTEPEAQE